MANVGLYAVGATPVYYVLNSGPIDKEGSTSIQGSVREQDLTPQFKQSVEGVGSVTDTPPTAEAAWRDFAGTLGLYRQSDAPGDLTRPFICDADNTRPGQLTAWLQWPGGATVVVDPAASGGYPSSFKALVNATDAWGFLGTDPITARTTYWKWNGTKFAFQWYVSLSNEVPGRAPSTRMATDTNVYVAGTFPQAVIQPTDTNLWMMATGGAIDAAVAVAGVTATSIPYGLGTFVYFDLMFVVCSQVLFGATGNLVVYPFRPRTPITGNIPLTVAYAGLTPALGTITGETGYMGAAPCEGAVYICTDRSVYAMQWNDLLNTMLFTKLLEMPRITSAPCVWNGEVYIGVDNRILHIVPGQRGFDWRVPDPAGRLSLPFAGTIVSLTPTPDALLAQVVDTSGSGSTTGSCLMRMDTNGIWTIVDVLNSGTIKLYSGPPIPVVDGTNPQGIAFLNWGGSTFTSATVLPLPQAGRNPQTLVTTQRKQRPGPFRVISPWYDLESETAQKQLERFRDAVQGVSDTYPITVDYQTDYDDEVGTDTYTSGVAKTTGLWHPCGYLGTSGAGYSGTTSASGNGAIWFEFDGSTSYPHSIGVLPLYPTYKRVRWCLSVSGDPTGATVPTLLSHAFHRLEYVTKAYERDIAIRLRVGETQGAGQLSGVTVTYADSAAIKAARDRVKALNSAKSKCTYVDEWGDAQTVVITKYSASITDLGADGRPAGYILNLSIMDVPLTGQN